MYRFKIQDSRLKFTTWQLLLALTNRNFHIHSVNIQKAIIQIKRVVIDNIHYINFSLILVVCCVFTICPAQTGVRLIPLCILYAIKYATFVVSV